MRTKMLWIGVPGLAAAAPVSAQSYTETFENGVNVGGWTMVGGPGGAIIPTGGNPGAYFGGTNFNYPDIQTRARGQFTGDYAARFVTKISAQFITLSHQGAIFPMTLALVSDNGTVDPNDDWGAYMTGTQNVPNTGEGWRAIDFAVSPLSPVLPSGWQMWDIGGTPPPQRDWPRLMRDVGQIRFLYAPPGTISNFPVWNTGVDNIAITESCYANCDFSTLAPFLNVMDFTCFLNTFGAGNTTKANCDASTLPPVLNVNDFVCFVNRFVVGCPSP